MSKANMSKANMSKVSTSKVNVGVHAIGYVLPETRRTNDWWPPEVVERWCQRRSKNPGRNGNLAASQLTDGVRAAIEAIESQRSDPFLGIKERRVIDSDKRSSDLEIEAAEKAMTASGIDRSEIGLLLVHSMLPDDLNAPNSCLIHRRLGLREQCFSMSTTTACNGFLMHLSIAEKMISSGQVRYALLINSGVLTPLQKREMPLSCIFGDGASAVVVGPVSDGRGILGQDHRTNGEYYNVVRIGVPGAEWYESGRSYMYIDDGPTGHRMLLEVPDMGRQVIAEALRQAELSAEAVSFYASHQGTAWFRRVSQAVAGLSNARAVDTFDWTGNLSSANIPIMCALGSEQGLLNDGDIVAMYSGGSAITWSGVVMRWGA